LEERIFQRLTLTVLHCKALPDSSLVFKNESILGGKMTTERLTV
jgi:hypothetical protein